MNTTKRKELPRVRLEMKTGPLTADRRHAWTMLWEKLLTDKQGRDGNG